MNVLLYMAISANGIIARVNNEEDFLSHENWNTLLELTHKTKCMIWGRKTYDIVKTWEKKYIEELKDTTKVIISNDLKLKLEENYLTAFSPREALKKLEDLGFTQVVISGGSTLNSSFAKEGLIDEIIVNIEPVIIGKGIPLFKQEEFDINLKLLAIKKLNDKIIQLHYQVIKE